MGELVVWLSYRFRHTRRSLPSLAKMAAHRKQIEYSRIVWVLSCHSKVKPKLRNRCMHGPLLARRRTRFVKGFRRIEKTLMPQSRVRQFARLPLLKCRERRRNHPTVNGIEDHNNPSQFLLLLRQFRIVLVEHGLRELQPELRSRILPGLVCFFDRNDLYVFSTDRRPISRKRRRLLPRYMKQFCGYGNRTRWRIVIRNAVGHCQVVAPDPSPRQARNAD